MGIEKKISCTTRNIDQTWLEAENIFMYEKATYQDPHGR